MGKAQFLRCSTLPHDRLTSQWYEPWQQCLFELCHGRGIKGTTCGDGRARGIRSRALVCADEGCLGHMRKNAVWVSRAYERSHECCRKSRGPGAATDSFAT